MTGQVPSDPSTLILALQRALLSEVLLVRAFYAFVGLARVGDIFGGIRELGQASSYF